MLIRLGLKRRKPQRTGYSQDYCMDCQQAVTVEFWHYQPWLSIFWLPLIPLDKHQQWLCLYCQKYTSGRYHANLVSQFIHSPLTLATAIFIISERHAHIW